MAEAFDPFFIQAHPPTEGESLFRAKYTTMEFHCNSIVFTMADSEQLSITLPKDALEMIDNGLIPFGLYGKKRATICSELILAALRTPEVQANVRDGRAKAAKG